MARPNVLLFNDFGWLENRAEQQNLRFQDWQEKTSRRVVIEMGAGKAIPTVRHFSERHGPRVIRINPNDFKIAPHLGAGIQGRSLEVLLAIEAALGEMT